MIFSEDSTFRAAKRALLVTSSISILLFAAGIEIGKVNFGFVELNVNRPLVVYVFLFIAVTYQWTVLRNRGSIFFASKQLEPNLEIAKQFRAGKKEEDFPIEARNIAASLKNYREKLIDIQGKYTLSFNMLGKTYMEVIGSLDAVEALDNTRKDKLRKDIENFINLRDRDTILKQILKDDGTIRKRSSQVRWLDFYFPLGLGALAIIFLLIAVFFEIRLLLS